MEGAVPSLLGCLNQVFEGLRLGLSILNTFTPSLNAPRFVPPEAIDDGNKFDISANLAVALLGVIYRVDGTIIETFSQNDDLKEFTGITKPLDINYPCDIDRFNSLLLKTLSPDSKPVSSTEESNPPQLKHTLGAAMSIDQRDSLVDVASDCLIVLECIIRVLLGMNHNDLDSFNRLRKNERIMKINKKINADDYLSAYVLQFISFDRPELRCLVGSGVPRCLRIYSLLEQLMEIAKQQKLGSALIHGQCRKDVTLHGPGSSDRDSSLPVDPTFFDLAVAIASLGLGILADDIKNIESRISSLDGFRILIHFKQFNSDIILLGLQKPILHEYDGALESKGRQTYISRSGKRKKTPGFRSSIGTSTGTSVGGQSFEEGFEEGSNWILPSNAGQLLFSQCSNCKMQVRRTVADSIFKESRRMQHEHLCIACRKPLKIVVDCPSVASTNLVLDSSIKDQSVAEEGEVFFNDESSERLEMIELKAVTNEPTSTTALEIEHRSSNVCCWIRPSNSCCISYALENIEKRYGPIHQMIRDNITIRLLDQIIKPAQTFSLPSTIKPGATFYPPGITAAKPMPSIVDWIIPCHGWILNLLDDLQDVEIRVATLELLKDLFVLRPLEYRTWNVRYTSHIPILASVYDNAINVVRSALNTVLHSSALAPLKDGGIKKIVRLFEHQDFGLRLYLLCDILCRARYSDNKSIRLLIRGIMNGNSPNRLLFQRDLWERLVHHSTLTIILKTSNTILHQAGLLPFTLAMTQIDEVDFHLDWGTLNNYNNAALLWMSLCARCCFTIGINHQFLFESVVSTLPISRSPKNVEDSGTSIISSESESDVLGEVLGIVAFVMGTKTQSTTADGFHQMIRGWDVKIDVSNFGQIAIINRIFSGITNAVVTE